MPPVPAASNVASAAPKMASQPPSFDGMTMTATMIVR
jgi:hypothetical protein